MTFKKINEETIGNSFAMKGVKHYNCVQKHPGHLPTVEDLTKGLTKKRIDYNAFMKESVME